MLNTKTSCLSQQLKEQGPETPPKMPKIKAECCTQYAGVIEDLSGC